MSLHDDVARLADTAQKLLAEATRLHRDVVTLCMRIEPYDGEKEPRNPAFVEHDARAKWPVPAALNLISGARAFIQSSEFHLSAIRARLDGISDDVLSREEMKQWIKSSRRDA